MTEVIQNISRREFVARFMRQCGMNYSQACQAYKCMCAIFADGVVSGSKIRLGQVGALIPVWRKPKEVVMTFKVVKGRRIVRSHRTYAMGGRYTFKFVLYDTFVNTHSLRWFADDPSR